MSTTIAVSLITALSTLTGASISGYIAFLVGRTQAKTQEQITRNALMNQQLTEVRQIKKDVYVSFVSQITVVETALLDLGRPTPETPSRDEFEKLLKSLGKAISDLRYQNDLVTIEGAAKPALVAAEILKLLTKLAMNLEMAARTWYDTGFGGVHDLIPRGEEINLLAKLKNELVAAVKESLNEPLID